MAALLQEHKLRNFALPRGLNETSHSRRDVLLAYANRRGKGGAMQGHERHLRPRAGLGRRHGPGRDQVRGRDDLHEPDLHQYPTHEDLYPVSRGSEQRRVLGTRRKAFFG